jgi:fermentation-respiration switch protein FrsA (DUF1100 family)
MYFETNLVFPGASAERGDWLHPEIELEEVDFQSADGTALAGYFLSKPNAKVTVLFCHGNEENIAMLAPEMQQLRERLNANVMVFDYRGFGRSAGEPFERGILEDAEAAAVWLAQRTDQTEDDLVYIGRSLGGGVAVHLASILGGRGLVLERTFSSVVDVAASRYWWLPVRFVMRNQFLSVAKIKYFDGPLLQMHGDVDEVIPLWSAQRLFERSPSQVKEFQLIKGLTHNAACPEVYLVKLQQFIEGLP